MMLNRKEHSEFPWNITSWYFENYSFQFYKIDACQIFIWSIFHIWFALGSLRLLTPGLYLLDWGKGALISWSNPLLPTEIFLDLSFGDFQCPESLYSSNPVRYSSCISWVERTFSRRVIEPVSKDCQPDFRIPGAL